MVLTFAQYSILKATYKCATYHQVEQQTNFDSLMINYYLMGLLRIGLVKAIGRAINNTHCYELTDLGSRYLDDYEKANPSLVIRRPIN